MSNETTQASPNPEKGNTSTHTSNASSSGEAPHHFSPLLSEKQRGELWLYIAISIAAVEILIAVGSVIYGFMAANAAGNRQMFAFPWLYWAAMAISVPGLILLLVHFADVGLFRPPSGAESEQEWQHHLPQRLQRLYRIVKGAPAAMVLLCLVLLGAALMTLDGAFTMLMDFASALKPYIPHITGGLTAVLIIVVLAVVWLNFRTRKLIAEYQFRREVLEKTGVIILDKDSAALPPGGVSDVPYQLISGESGSFARPALPSGAPAPLDGTTTEETTSASSAPSESATEEFVSPVPSGNARPETTKE